MTNSSKGQRVARFAAMPDWIKPQLAALEAWLHELKLDGYPHRGTSATRRCNVSGA